MRESDFWEAMRDDLYDDLVRLAYADWLDERADPKGELIRCSVERASLHPDSADALILSARECRLLHEFGPDWFGTRSPELLDRFRLHRGLFFPRVTVQEWDFYGEHWLSGMPLGGIWLSDTGYAGTQQRADELSALACVGHGNWHDTIDPAAALATQRGLPRTALAQELYCDSHTVDWFLTPRERPVQELSLVLSGRGTEWQQSLHDMSASEAWRSVRHLTISAWDALPSGPVLQAVSQSRVNTLVVSGYFDPPAVSETGLVFKGVGTLDVRYSSQDAFVVELLTRNEWPDLKSVRLDRPLGLTQVNFDAWRTPVLDGLIVRDGSPWPDPNESLYTPPRRLPRLRHLRLSSVDSESPRLRLTPTDFEWQTESLSADASHELLDGLFSGEWLPNLESLRLRGIPSDDVMFRLDQLADLNVRVLRLELGNYPVDALPLADWFGDDGGSTIVRGMDGLELLAVRSNQTALPAAELLSAPEWPAFATFAAGYAERTPEEWEQLEAVVPRHLGLYELLVSQNFELVPPSLNPALVATARPRPFETHFAPTGFSGAPAPGETWVA